MAKKNIVIEETPEVVVDTTPARKSLDPEPTDYLKVGFVTGGRLNLRKTAAANGEIIAILNDGDTITTADDTSKKWMKVNTNNNKVGYVMSEFIRLQ